MLTKSDLVNDMARGCKPAQEYRIGIEHEQFVFNKKDGKPLPYDGTPGIKQLLEDLQRFGWKPVMEGEYIIGLSQDDGRAISLEPGGQFEIATPPYQTTAQVKATLEDFYKNLQAAGESLGIGAMAKGFPPQWPRDEIHWMPKARYRIMREYMPRVGKHGLDMMKRTAGVQINLDFSSEDDMVKKFRVAMGIQPVITALLANSNMADGKDTGYVSYRSHIWTETDPMRCGVPAFIFESHMGFEAYVDYALAAPMYFIYRDGKYTDASGLSFIDFMKGTLPGHPGMVANMNDWHNHLTTLFPEVRLKTYLELRGPDSVEKERIYAMMAFWIGLLYDQSALDGAWDLIKNTPAQDHQRLRNDTAKYGLDAKLYDGRRLASLAGDVLKLAQDGISRNELEKQNIGDLEIFLNFFAPAL